MDPLNLARTARLLAIPLPFALAGYSFAFSQNAVPHLYTTPAEHSTPIFKGVFNSGAQVVLPGAIFSAAGAAYLAYSIPAQQRLWATIAVVNVMPLVFTGVVMMTGIRRLLVIEGDKGKQARATQSLEVRQLLKTWVWQNYVRAGLFLVSGVLAWRAAGGVV
ncbi:hypothetical protein LTR62_005026 [Meristemomyces frigidus]|uniref:DUF1772-domain-containing protein n=1 Tax=Meristemomyces frigidus TaxID=1508187 RepID=A0AAN7TQY4_9PEZI|nr:hypothetical protein LTR62_005026 [Meristemomyces frigidus]